MECVKLLYFSYGLVWCCFGFGLNWFKTQGIDKILFQFKQLAFNGQSSMHELWLLFCIFSKYNFEFECQNQL